MDHRFLLEIQIPDPNDFFYLLLFFLRFLKEGSPVLAGVTKLHFIIDRQRPQLIRLLISPG